MKKNDRFIHVKPGQEAAIQHGKSLLNEALTGLIIEDFFSVEECQNFVEVWKQISDNEKTTVNEGFLTLPLSFAQFTQLKDANQMSTEAYLDIASNFRQRIVPLFGIDVEQRLKDCFSKLFPNHTFQLLWNQEFEKNLVPFNIRELKPGNGELIAHCENLFFKEFPSFFEWLQQHGVRNNQFSFFLTLQNTEKGGELNCFDFLWDDVKERVEYELLKDESGNLIHINGSHVYSSLIKPKVGSLLLFNGGNIWHRVEKVMGQNSRMTLGGFVSSSKHNPADMYIWA
ncbi:MAG: hypothetical protein RL511_311 [Bacteroidota bacterium]|jgi:hypothetical protein